MRLRLLLVAILVVTLAALSACDSAAPPSGPVGPTPSPSATQDLLTQAAQAGATVNAAVTLVADANNSAKAISDQLTDTAEAPTLRANETKNALSVIQTESSLRITEASLASWAGTATNDANKSTSTATAAIADSLREDARQDLQLQNEKMTQGVAAWAPWAVGGGVLAIIIFVAALVVEVAITSHRKILPEAVKLIKAMTVRARTFITPDGAVHIAPEGERLQIANSSRMLNPMLIVEHDGTIASGGGARDETLQTRIALRAGAATVAAALSRSQGNAFRRVVSDVPQPTQTTALAGDMVEAEVVIIDPGDPRIQPVVRDAEQQLLGSGDNNRHELPPGGDT